MILERILHRLLDPRHRDAVLGDLRETFEHQCQTKGPAAATRWHFGESIRLMVFALMTRSGFMREVVRRVLVSLALLITLWAVSFALNQWAQQTLPGGWRITEATLLLCAALGIPIARRIHARMAVPVLLWVVAFGVAEFVIHLGYGIHWVQGAPNHFAVMIAAVLGLLMGRRTAPNRRDHTLSLTPNA